MKKRYFLYSLAELFLLPMRLITVTETGSGSSGNWRKQIFQNNIGQTVITDLSLNGIIISQNLFF